MTNKTVTEKKQGDLTEEIHNKLKNKKVLPQDISAKLLECGIVLSRDGKVIAVIISNSDNIQTDKPCCIKLVCGNISSDDIDTLKTIKNNLFEGEGYW